MDELIQAVADKAGISVDQAKSAIEAVLAHFKDKLPFGIGDKLESYLQGGGTDSSSSGDSSSSSDLLGGLKDKIEGLF